jgi:hypothetical protein
MDDLMECEAGQAYILRQLDPKSRAIKPIHVCESSSGGVDSSWYEIYEDRSLWFVNNAADEVWTDYTDFVEMSLLPGIEADETLRRGLSWNEDAIMDSDDISNSWLSEMDQQILLLYFGRRRRQGAQTDRTMT